MDKFVPLGCLYPSNVQPLSGNFPPVFPEIFNSLFTRDELTFSLHNLKDSAQGLDGITYSMMIFNLPNKIKPYLTLINHILFVVTKIPNDWLSFNIIPI